MADITWIEGLIGSGVVAILGIFGTQQYKRVKSNDAVHDAQDSIAVDYVKQIGKECNEWKEKYRELERRSEAKYEALLERYMKLRDQNSHISASLTILNDQVLRLTRKEIRKDPGGSREIKDSAFMEINDIIR